MGLEHVQCFVHLFLKKKQKFCHQEQKKKKCKTINRVTINAISSFNKCNSSVLSVSKSIPVIFRANRGSRCEIFAKICSPIIFFCCEGFVAFNISESSESCRTHCLRVLIFFFYQQNIKFIGCSSKLEGDKQS